MLTADEPPVKVACIAVGEGARAAKDHQALLFIPAVERIARKLAEEQIAALRKPDRALDPAKAARQPLQHRWAGDQLAQLVPFDLQLPQGPIVLHWAPPSRKPHKDTPVASMHCPNGLFSTASAAYAGGP